MCLPLLMSSNPCHEYVRIAENALCGQSSMCAGGVRDALMPGLHLRFLQHAE